MPTTSRRSTSPTSSRNPSLPIRAVPTQRTVGSGDFAVVVTEVAISPYRSGRFRGGGRFPLAQAGVPVAISPHPSGKFRPQLHKSAPMVEMRKSQSFPTDQGSSDRANGSYRSGRPARVVVAIPPYRSGQFRSSQPECVDFAITPKSQSLPTDQGSSDGSMPGRLGFTT